MRGFRQIRRKKGVYGLRLFRTAGRQSLCAGRSGDAALPGGNRHHPEAGGGRRHRAAPLRSARHRLQQVLHRHAATADSGAEYGRIVRHSGNSDFQQIYAERLRPFLIQHLQRRRPQAAGLVCRNQFERDLQQLDHSACTVLVTQYVYGRLQQSRNHG